MEVHSLDEIKSLMFLKNMNSAVILVFIILCALTNSITSHPSIFKYRYNSITSSRRESSPSIPSCKNVTSTSHSSISKRLTLNELEHRRQFIADMTLEAWNAYYRNAWGQYDLHPLTLSKQDGSLAYSGATLTGAMSTLWLMDLKDEFERGKQWIQKEMIIDKSGLPKVGALLSCYALSGDVMFRDKAMEIVELFKPTDLYTKSSGYVHKTLILSEWMKQRLEYAYLSNITGDCKYRERIKEIDGFFAKNREEMKSIDEDDKMNWMVKVKAYIQSKGRDLQDLTDFNSFIESMESSGHLRPTESGSWYFREVLSMPYMNNWYCHFGAALALAQMNKLDSRITDFWVRDSKELRHTVKQLDMAKQITELCHDSMRLTETGLPPLKFFVDEFTEKLNETVFLWKDQDCEKSRSFWLNPHLAESYFVLWRLTHEEKYRYYAWELAKAIHKHCRTKNGYAQVRDVMELPTRKEDTQPPEFLSATLKYLYLTFAPDDVLPLDQWVFNVDGQPLPVLDYGTGGSSIV